MIDSSCVAITSAAFAARVSSRRSSAIPRLRVGSRFPVGSSARTRSGPVTSARAIATRWRSPCERRWIARRSLPPSPTRARSSAARARAAASSRSVASRRNGRRTFSRTSSDATSSKVWKTWPVRRARRVRRAASVACESRTPPRSTSPSVATSSPERSPRSVLFPEPDGPRTTSERPPATANGGVRRVKPVGRRKTSAVVRTTGASPSAGGVDGACGGTRAG